MSEDVERVLCAECQHVRGEHDAWGCVECECRRFPSEIAPWPDEA